MSKLKKIRNEIPLKAMRVHSANLKTYQKTSTGWKVIPRHFPELETVIKLFKAHKSFTTLIDTKDPRFLKGWLCGAGEVQGGRIVILPTGERLEKSFSLFSQHLKIHEETSHDHWDVLYQNKGGTWSYVYTKEKRQKHLARKYKKVHHFAKHYQKLLRSVQKSLWDDSDLMALPMYTLLKTYMRIGNETYFKVNGHKGLATLTKKNIKLNIKTREVEFSFVSKNGIPITLYKKFPSSYVTRLASLLKKRKNNEFVFITNGRPLREHDFKTAFLRYCGHEFYPHIVRSHYATLRVKNFLKKSRATTKEECEKLFLSIAHELGHRKFDKKKQQWNDNYAVTLQSYVQPELVDKMHRIIKSSQ